MADFLEVVDVIEAEASTAREIFRGEGQRVRGRWQSTPEYKKQLVEATRFLREVMTGKRPAYMLREVMTTDDFPLLFGDIMDRQLLANYAETPVTYPNYARVTDVPDFRPVRRLAVDGAESSLDVVPQASEYPETDLDAADHSYSVRKFGRRIPLSWETFVNDDIGALRDIPERFGRAARRTEERFATQLFVGPNGPLGGFYDASNGNVVPGNPELSIAGLQAAWSTLAAQTDSEGEPVFIEAVELVVPPALAIVAQNILNATQIELAGSGGTTEQRMTTANWMRNLVRLSVNAYIPNIATTANGNSSWFMFTRPEASRPALEIGFLQGHRNPEVWVKSANARRVGGGDVDPFEGDFDTDAVQYRVRHVLGGTRIDPKATVASNGSGS